MSITFAEMQDFRLAVVKRQHRTCAKCPRTEGELIGKKANGPRIRLQLFPLVAMPVNGAYDYDPKKWQGLCQGCAPKVKKNKGPDPRQADWCPDTKARAKGGRP